MGGQIKHWSHFLVKLCSVTMLRQVRHCISQNFHYTPGIYAEGYIAFALMFVRSCVRSFVRVLVRSLLSVTFVEFTTKFLVKVSLSEYISLTKHQKAFIFEPWVPERVSFHAMSFGPRVDAPGWG